MSEGKITMVEIITRPSKFDELKEELNKIHVTGMTVTQVLGCGAQKGKSDIYRGVHHSVNLLPKIRIEIVVCEVPVEQVLEVAERILKTGNIGDGKVFVYDVKDALRVRTGERGPDAIKSSPEQEQLEEG